MNHVVIYPFGEGDDAAVAIGSKMLYASHYFHTALELKFLVKDSANPEEGRLLSHQSEPKPFGRLDGSIRRHRPQHGAVRGSEGSCLRFGVGQAGSGGSLHQALLTIEPLVPGASTGRLRMPFCSLEDKVHVTENAVPSSSSFDGRLLVLYH